MGVQYENEIRIQIHFLIIKLKEGLVIMEYKTRQRDIIETLINRIGERHFTADEIYLLLTQEERKVGKTTIYRYLERLVAEGSLNRFRNEDGSSSYYKFKKNEGCDDHFHLKCLQCGKMLHIECSYLEELNKHISEHHGFSVDSTKAVLYGYCAECEGKGIKKL